MDRYRDRQEAGKILAAYLTDYKNKLDTIVLALPRGGVPVAFEIANELNLPLDIFIVRKLGVPGHNELAFGAIALGNVRVFNDDVLQMLSLTQEEINSVIAKEQKELARREQVYRGNRGKVDLANKTVILVDDGIATGATMRAAIAALTQLGTAKIIVAVPVADESIIALIEPSVDQLICPLRPPFLQAVGLWYQDFSQTEDEQVFDLLQRAKVY